MNPLDMIKESKCYTCRYCLSRVIEPILPEDKAHYMELLDIEDTEDYDLYIEQHRCLVTDEDLDGITRECSQYSPKEQTLLIREYKF